MAERRVAVVTGSTSGIGLGVAEGFARSGFDLMLNGFATNQEVAALLEKMRALGVRANFHPADLSQPEQCTALITATEQTFGRVDVLVNNAGIQHTAPVEQFPAERWDAILAVNLSAAFHTTRAVLPGMQQRGWGRIVNIASVHGLVASVQKIAYVAAKHGLIGMTKVVALENARRGITCNAVCPGWVLTPLVEAQIVARAQREGTTHEQAAAGLLAEKQPSSRFTTVEDIAELVLFLAGDAAAYITGASLPMDGGWTAQ
jgi:3-hydroxybutyrate dehydrogenase